MDQLICTSLSHTHQTQLGRVRWASRRGEGEPNPPRETKKTQARTGAEIGGQKFMYSSLCFVYFFALIGALLLLLFKEKSVVAVVFTLKTVLTSIQYPSLSYSSRQRNEFPWS